MGLAYAKIPIRDTWSDDCIRKVHRKAAKGKKEITKIWFSLCWKKLCLRRYSFQRAVNQRDQHNEVWNCAVQKTKQEAVSTCRMPAHLGVWHRPSESLAVFYVQWEGFWCWSGFMHSFFLHVLLKGFSYHDPVISGLLKRGGVHEWLDLSFTQEHFSLPLQKHTGPRTSAKTSFPWVINVS